MKKKIPFLIITLVMLLSGCEYHATVNIYESFWKSGDEILLWSNHHLIRNHPYDFAETEDGYDLIIHFAEDK